MFLCCSPESLWFSSLGLLVKYPYWLAWLELFEGWAWFVLETMAFLLPFLTAPKYASNHL